MLLGIKKPAVFKMASVGGAGIWQEITHAFIVPDFPFLLSRPELKNGGRKLRSKFYNHFKIPFWRIFGRTALLMI